MTKRVHDHYAGDAMYDLANPTPVVLSYFDLFTVREIEKEENRRKELEKEKEKS